MKEVLKQQINQSDFLREVNEKVSRVIGPIDSDDCMKLILTLCKSFNITPEELFSKSRLKAISDCRHMSFYIIHSVYGVSFTGIGYLFNRDHSTVITGFKKTETMLDIYSQYNDIYAKALKSINKYDHRLHVTNILSGKLKQGVSLRETVEKVLSTIK